MLILCISGDETTQFINGEGENNERRILQKIYCGSNKTW